MKDLGNVNSKKNKKEKIESGVTRPFLYFLKPAIRSVAVKNQNKALQSLQLWSNATSKKLYKKKKANCASRPF